jgi:hypothetical protein
LVGGVWAWHMTALIAANRYTFLFCEALVEIAVAYGAYKLYSLAYFALSREMKGIRVFGYYASGAQGKELLRAVYWKACETAREEYRGSHVLVNADQHDPLLPCFDGKAHEPKTAAKKKKTFTRFLHKALLPAGTNSHQYSVEWSFLWYILVIFFYGKCTRALTLRMVCAMLPLMVQGPLLLPSLLCCALTKVCLVGVWVCARARVCLCVCVCVCVRARARACCVPYVSVSCVGCVGEYREIGVFIENTFY